MWHRKRRVRTGLFTVALALASWSLWADSAKEFREGPLQTQQARYSRVNDARAHQWKAIDKLYAAAGVDYPAAIFVRAFKEEGVLEVWAWSGAKTRFVLITRVPFTGYSGDLGPKRRRFDRQIPEGFYRIDSFNGASRYHLSLHVDYPNESDRILSNRSHPGNNIFIHGNELTNGCIPIGNHAIEQLYIILLDSTSAGHDLPLHIFPCRFSSPACTKRLASSTRHNSKLAAFWENLRDGFVLFEKDGVPPLLRVDASGRYLFGPQISEVASVTELSNPTPPGKQ